MKRSSLVLFVVLFCISTMGCSKEEKLLYTYGQTASMEITISPDGKHVVFRKEINGKYVAIFDGKVGKQYDGIRGLGNGEYFSFSPNSQHFYYIAILDGKQHFMIDDKEGPAFDIAGLMPVFSPDGNRTAYWGYLKGKWFHVVDGKEEDIVRIYPENSSTPIFSSDSRHIAYTTKRDWKGFCIIDGKEMTTYDEVMLPVFSPDGNHNAYWAKLKDSWFVVVDGKEENKYALHSNEPKPPIFSFDSKHLAYVASLGKKECLVVDRKEEKQYDVIDESNIKFSPDGKHLAYVAGVNTGHGYYNHKWFIVVDGKEGAQYDEIKSLIISPDGKRNAYWAVQDDKIFVVVDGNEQKEKHFCIQHGNIYNPIFSPDSKHIAFVAKDSSEDSSINKNMVVIDGKQEEKYDDIDGESLCFSPDSKRVAYMAFKIGQGFYAVVDGKVESLFPSRDYNQIIFSQDSKHVAFLVRDEHEYIVLDGKKEKEYNGISRLTFEPPNKLHYCGWEISSKNLYYIEKTL
jgi:hypothetical protein